MELFFQNCLAFPAVLFSGLLIIVVFYWVCAAFGLLDIDILNVDAPDLTFDPAVPDAAGFAGWLTKLGLAGIPVTVILTLFTLIGWLLSYFSVYGFIGSLDSIFIRLPVSVIALVIITYISLRLTVLCLKPVREKLANRRKPKSVDQLIGRTAVVRSGSVTEKNGEATMEDGGAGLLLQIRSDSQTNITRGDLVVLISYDAATHSYQVITEAEFRHG